MAFLPASMKYLPMVLPVACSIREKRVSVPADWHRAPMVHYIYRMIRKVVSGELLIQKNNGDEENGIDCFADECCGHHDRCADQTCSQKNHGGGKESI